MENIFGNPIIPRSWLLNYLLGFIDVIILRRIRQILKNIVKLEKQTLKRKLFRFSQAVVNYKFAVEVQFNRTRYDQQVFAI